VGRGQPASLVLSPATRYVTSPQRVGGHDTYVRTEPLAAPEREFTWKVGPTTFGFIGGFGMTDDELLRIADSVSITA
jgi:hypothetical protein